MILLDFRYQDPWAEENFTLPDFVQQSQTSTSIYGMAIQSEKEWYFQQFTLRIR